MIRRFQKEDLRSFTPNQFSDPSMAMGIFDQPGWEVFTQKDNDHTVAIICAQRYWGNNYSAFFLISENFSPRNAVKLKDFVHSAHERFGVKRIQTDSQAHPVLDAWHEWLGFKLEGKREKMMHGKDYHCWGLNMGTGE